MGSVAAWWGRHGVRWIPKHIVFTITCMIEILAERLSVRPRHNLIDWTTSRFACCTLPGIVLMSIVENACG
jgi:hypothetical protein